MSHNLSSRIEKLETQIKKTYEETGRLFDITNDLKGQISCVRNRMYDLRLELLKYKDKEKCLST